MALAKTRLDMRPRQAGFTLLEMMIVVAIMGILAGIAVYAYRKVTSTAEIDSEVNAIFAELRVRQEEFHAENGVYLSTTPADTIYFPPGAPVQPGNAPIDIAPLLAAADGNGGTLADAWVNLRMMPRKTTLRCGYTAIAGDPTVSVPSRGASVLEMNTPAQEANWYYLVAECDADGDPGVNSLYLARHDREELIIQNKGR